jgi:DnaJ-class molecular chaperone
MLMLCRNCEGTGAIAESIVCPKCNGTAEIITYDSDGAERLQLCPRCEDGLIYIEHLCSICKGTGQLSL